MKEEIVELALPHILKLMIETDCPYLTPTTLGRIRNEPQYLPYVTEKIANVLNRQVDELNKQVDELNQIFINNTKNFFNLR